MKITTVGGFSEIGKNMVALEYKGEIVILDMGLHLENYINFTDDEDDNGDYFSAEELIDANAVPDDSAVRGKKVVAIIPSHGHLDHVGAIPYLAQKYDAPIICTPYTGAVIKSILKDKGLQIKNEIITVEMNGTHQITNLFAVEFVNITHSIPDAAAVVIHTPEGQAVYTNDFKLDDTPVMGEKPNYERLKELGDMGKVQVLFLDSLYSHMPGRTPSESEAREMLRKVMLEQDTKGKAVIVTTFSSHIARLKSIFEFGKQMKRKVVFLGRSLAKYIYAAEDIGLVEFNKSAEIAGYRKQAKKVLRKIEKEGRDKYLIVATGHQGEPNSILSRIADGRLGFKLFPDDIVIFSCQVIPTETTERSRRMLEKKLEDSKISMFKQVHYSGHARQEEQLDMMRMLKPKHVVPSHAGPERTIHLVELAKSLGYKENKTVHMMTDGQVLEI